MSRRRKVNPLRLVLIILIVIALCFIAFFAMKLGLTKVNEPKKEEPVVNDVIENTNEEVKISVEDYTVYTDDDNELGFNFILADLKFVSSKDSINYDLSNLSTAERIVLGDIKEYEEKLLSCGYDLSKLGYASEIINEQSNEETAKIFIPYVKVKGELCVYNGEVLKFNLYNNNVKASSLKLSDEIQSTTVDSKDYSLTIFNSYVEDSMYRNGEPAIYPSTVNIYAFIIRANQINDSKVIVEDAKYIPENSSAEIKALEEDYTSPINENIIGKELKTGDEYSLFFAITNPNNSEATFGGKVLIKFKNNSTWLELDPSQK
ncbi:MAG: hypothetical protein Q4F12_01175 [Erysipelotrichaceae bacterium]|nr:hypothetical protein [Erysipelotrichaceae bacterium]